MTDGDALKQRRDACKNKVRSKVSGSWQCRIRGAARAVVIDELTVERQLAFAEVVALKRYL